LDIKCSSPQRGKEAVGILAARADINLLFTDVVMPEMTAENSPIMLLQQRPGLKILFTTG